MLQSIIKEQKRFSNINERKSVKWIPSPRCQLCSNSPLQQASAQVLFTMYSVVSAKKQIKQRCVQYRSLYFSKLGQRSRYSGNWQVYSGWSIKLEGGNQGNKY
jgi:hypothetical protein